MIKNILVSEFKNALGSVSLDIDVDRVEVVRSENFGDYSTNIAMNVAKDLNLKPIEVAEKIKLALESSEIAKKYIFKVEIAEPGFINIYLKKEVFINSIKKVLEQGEKYGTNDSLKNKKIMVEYTQPNPFKPFHIGHLMSNAIGESISRIIEASGAEVIRANYQGDVGLHVAKSLWGLKKLNFDINDIEKIGEAYAFGHDQYEQEETAKAEIIEINKKIYKKSGDIIDLYNSGRKTSLEHFEEIYKMLGTKFDYYFFESETAEKGKDIVIANKGKVFEESDGAIIFDGEKYGLHKRVFITKDGIPTYEAKEIGLAFLKKEKENFDLSITTTAVEQQEYFKVVFKSLAQIDSSFDGKLLHIPHGMMQLGNGKMSSRKGNVITGESILFEVKDRALQKIKEGGIKETSEDLSTQISVGAIKYMILKQSPGKNIIFDQDSALSFEGNSGPYIQYTYARIQSIIEKSGSKTSTDDYKGEINKLERTLIYFPEVVENACRQYAPQHIATYLIDLAQEFNSYYGRNKIIGSNDEKYKLALVTAVSIVLKKGLTLLGIPAPLRM